MPFPTQTQLRKKLNEFLRLIKTDWNDYQPVIDGFAVHTLGDDEIRDAVRVILADLKAGEMKTGWKTEPIWRRTDYRRQIGTLFCKVSVAHRELADPRQEWDSPHDVVLRMWFIRRNP